MKNKWGIIGIIAIALLLGVAIALPSKKEEKTSYKEDLLGISYDMDGNTAELSQYKTENPVVAMKIQKYGSIVMELYPNVAPNTVANFISLVQSGFYDHNTFHRLVPGFVLQGGDPDGNGTGGPGYSIKGEFINNGVDNSLLHEKWIISMARSSEPDSAGSQFFICLDKASDLDGDYAAFGKVIDGYKNIEAIVKNEKVLDSSSGKLQKNLVIEKSVIDLKEKNYPEVEKIGE